MTINQTINKYKDLSFKDKAAYALAIAAFTLGWAITIAGFIVPPLGQIDSTVLWVLGQSLLFSGSVIGISQYYSAQLRDFKGNISNVIEEHIRRHEDQRLEQ